MGIIIAIDGEAGSGKSTIAKEIAKKLDYTYIDTGAMFRCVTLEALRNNFNPDDIDKIIEILKDLKISFKNYNANQRVILNGIDVTEDIRTEDVDDKVAEFAAVGLIRQKLKEMQQQMGENENIVMEGRDIGTTIFPNANIKFYIEVSEEERAMRRFKQNMEKGIYTSYEQVLANIKKRHKLETEREISPLAKADDAITINTTQMTLEESIERMMDMIKEKIGNNNKLSIKEIQMLVDEMVNRYNLKITPELRFIDLSSEIGELGKEIIKGSDYGTKEYKNTSELESEIGDVFFSLSCIANQLNINLEKALLKAMRKYKRRFDQKGHIGSNPEEIIDEK